MVGKTRPIHKTVVEDCDFSSAVLHSKKAERILKATPESLPRKI